MPFTFNNLSQILIGKGHKKKKPGNFSQFPCSLGEGEKLSDFKVINMEVVKSRLTPTDTRNLLMNRNPGLDKNLFASQQPHCCMLPGRAWCILYKIFSIPYHEVQLVREATFTIYPNKMFTNPLVKQGFCK